MIEQVRTRDTADMWEKTFTIDLLTHEGQCVGAIVWNEAHGKTIVWAKRVILATVEPGGCSGKRRIRDRNGRRTRHCIQGGAELRDMEFMQFHPTVLYIAAAPGI